MSTRRNPDLNMLLRHCSWKIMEFLIFGVRDLWDFIPKCEILFKIWDFIHETMNFDSNDHQHNIIKYDFIVSREEPIAKKIAETLLFGWVVGFLVSGCEILFMMWDFIPKCRVLFMKTLNLDSNNHGTQWKMYSELLYNSSSNNQIRFERYPCPKILQIHCFLDDYGILEYLKCEILFKIMT